MKRTLAVLLFCALAVLSASAQLTTLVGQTVATPLAAAGSATNQAGTVSNPSSNFIVNVTAGPVVCPGGDMQYINASTLTLAANTTNLLVWNCASQPSLYTKTAVTGPGSSGTTVGVPTSLLFATPGVELPISTIVCGSTNCGNTANGSLTDARVLANFPVINDGYFIVSPGSCAWNQSGGTLVTNGLANVGASFLPVNQISTTTTTLTAQLTCLIDPPTKVTANKGVWLNDVTLLYGPSTGTLQSCGTPTINTIALPTAASSETASTVTPVSIGALTVTPAVGSCNVTALTAGAMYTEKAAPATPFNIATDLQHIAFTQQFVGANAASEILYTAGLIVHYSYVPF